ncbi:Sarcolemmal membrane-associated protein [Bagarius yarrelli]|uniref:Sarcolemmal membrane-associated protein n=1 Tax=Bagarius yarrelli TaxID=175774 RepID=A0A556U3Z6_BAGYA|nr:Sarcolemmal membrane-associated protein [Bagarius yarrelli]
MPSALAVFTCRPNSHPFQERHVYLDEPVKIGRSVARCRPAQNNATFDCKVLSRNHALVWFDHKTGKFYLQDTKSSNGTFINSQRLSRGSEESPPCEVLSGDIIQFGVDVTENTRKGAGIYAHSIRDCSRSNQSKSCEVLLSKHGSGKYFTAI